MRGLNQTNGESGLDTASILRPLDQIPLGRIVLYLVLAWLMVELVKRFVPWVASRFPLRFRFFILPWAPLLRMLIVLTALFSVLPLVIDTRGEKLLAVFAAASVAVGFAFKDYISSLIAGVVILYERPYRVGDWVMVEGTYGEVKAINLRTMELVTPDDTLVIVPHNKNWSTSLFNANNGQRELQCVVDIYLRPDHDGFLVRQLLQDVAMTSCYVCLRRPLTVVAGEKPWGTHYRIRAYPIDCRDQFQFVTDLTLRAKQALRERGIEPAAALVTASPG